TLSAMAQHEKRQRRKTLNLAGLEELYFDDGFDSAKAAFERFADARTDWAVIKPGQGIPSQRTDLTDNSGIVYDDYSPPALWQPPYAVLLATLDSSAHVDYVSHPGEEIAVPIEGRVRFHFFWSEGRKKPGESRKDLSRGSALRLNPDVPHHAWGV